MLLDRYRTSHYQTYGKLTSLITVKKFEFRRKVGILLSKDRQELAKCLNIHRSEIWRLVQTMTDTFKVNFSYLTLMKKTYILLTSLQRLHSALALLLTIATNVVMHHKKRKIQNRVLTSPSKCPSCFMSIYAPGR